MKFELNVDKVSISGEIAQVDLQAVLRTADRVVSQLAVLIAAFTQDDAPTQPVAPVATSTATVTRELLDKIPPAVLSLVPTLMARTYKILPLSHDAVSNVLTIAICTMSTEPEVVADLQNFLGVPVAFVYAEEDDIEICLDRYYPMTRPQESPLG